MSKLARWAAALILPACVMAEGENEPGGDLGGVSRDGGPDRGIALADAAGPMDFQREQAADVNAVEPGDVGPVEPVDAAGPPGDSGEPILDAALSVPIDRPLPGPCGPDVDVADLAALAGDDGAYDGDLAGAPANMVGSCGGAAGGERVFRWTVTGAVDRLIFSTRHPETVLPTVLYVRTSCAELADVGCDRGAADPGAQVALENPAPGDYFVVVDTGSRDGGGRFRLSVREVRPPACRNEMDDDADGRLDLADPGCEQTEDPDEADPAEIPACANGADDDGDGLSDYPNDPDCAAAGALREAPLCALDSPLIPVGQAGGRFPLPLQEGFGGATPGCDVTPGPETVLALTLTEPSHVTLQVDAGGARPPVALYARTDCRDPASETACVRPGVNAPLSLRALDPGVYFLFVEQGQDPAIGELTATVTVESLVRECNDQADNDNDGHVDLLDPGCEQGLDDDEGDPADVPQCGNDFDDDADGLVDYPLDDGCEAAGDPDELSRDRHLSEAFNPDGVGQIWCNAGGDIRYHDYGNMTFNDCDALANRTGTQYYAGTAWENEPGEGWLGHHDEATATVAFSGGQWDRTERRAIDQPWPCRLALMPHRTEPDVEPAEELYQDAEGRRWHYWVMRGQTHSQCLSWADTVRGRILNPWVVGLGREPMITSPTHWCHAGPVFNQDGRGVNSDERADCCVGFWE